MKKTKISIIINIIITILVTIGTVFMLIDFQFMGREAALTATRIETFKFFTVDSNILMGIVSFIYTVFALKLEKKEIKEIPSFVYLLKLASTTGVVLTFLVTGLFLAPTSKIPFFAFYKNSNLFFHLLVPILSFITFCFLEKSKKLSFKQTIIGVIPMIAYSIIYTTSVLTHIENGIVSNKYDFYGFLRGGLNTIIFVISLMFIITYGISIILWYLNREKTV